MEKDERLLPLPDDKDLQPITNDFTANYSPMYDSGFNQTRSVREYINVLYKRLPIILALTVLATTVVAFYMYRLPSIFEATTTMIIEPRKPNVTSKDAININFGGNDANYYNTQLRLLQNSDLIRDVVIESRFYTQPNLLGEQNRGVFSTFRSIFSGGKTETEKADTLPTLTNADVESTDIKQVVLTPDEKERTERYTAILADGLKVEQEERTNIVSVRVRSTNRLVAAQTANQIVNTFIKQDTIRETQGAKETYDELSKSIDKLRETINGQELQLLNLLGSSNLPLGENGSTFRASVLQTSYGQYQEAANDRLKLEARYKTALQANANGKGNYVPDVTDSPIYQSMLAQQSERRAKLEDRIRDLNRQISEAENQKAQLLVKYTPAYILVVQKEKEIDELKKNKDQLQKEVEETLNKDEKKINSEAISGALARLRSQLESAQGREAKLYSLYKAEEAKANDNGRSETQLTTSKREIETNRGLLDTYIQRQKEQELAITSSRPDNVKMLTEATAPLEPVGPQRNRNIIIAFLISLGAGIGLAFLLDYLDDSVRSSDDVSRHLGLPTLAMIPYQSAAERGGKRRLLPSGNNAGTPNSMALITLEDNKSAMSEAYRHLRTSLLFSNAGHPPKTILVTSSQPAEGKTTTAINTAITLAQSGADVVIIDCDLRRPRLHSHFEMDNTHGLTNYLSGDRSTENLLKTFPGLPKLKVITSGPIPPNPAELLSSNEMKNLLQFLKGGYKHIVIDSPPAISFTDAAIISTLVDGVILVAMVGKSSIHLMRRFKQRLGNIGARIYGVVLNGMKANSAEYGYYGYDYAYKYYTVKDDDDSTPLMEDLQNQEEWEEEILSIHQTKG